MARTPVAKKKLIEVALPLEAINKASDREGSIYRGNPSALHKWWAQRPLAAARAVIFAQMVDDPSSRPDIFPTEKAQEKERQRLFRIIEDLVKWENTTNEDVLQRAREEIWQSWRHTCAQNADHPRAKELFDRHKLPAFHDPFAGGGTLPLEAQRLGLEAYASDLNPVAVLINKAMIEIPPKFAGQPPVNPEARARLDHSKTWRGAEGLAEDVRYYGQWMRDEAEKRIGHLYPPAEVTRAMADERPDLKPYVGRKLTVIAWLWARTVKSPNPAFAHVDVPLASTFMLATKAGKEAYVEPVIEGGGYRFTVKVGKPSDAEAVTNGTKLARGANFRCVMSGTPIEGDYVKAEGQAGRMGARLMAIVTEGDRGRVYLPPTEEHEAIARSARPEWKPEGAMVEDARAFTPHLYGLKNWSDLFTERQLAALTTCADLVSDARTLVDSAVRARVRGEGKTGCGGEDREARYPEAIATFLAFALDKTAEYGCTAVPWYAKEDRPKGLFTRQAVPMVWDFAEVNCLTTVGGSLHASIGIVAGALSGCVANGSSAVVRQIDAVRPAHSPVASHVISVDPPYYNNVGYADLSDFFYVWLRHSVGRVYPDLFVTIATPKDAELVATPHRHGGSDDAEAFFLAGMTEAFTNLASETHPAFPVSIYYAFKQSERDKNVGIASTGWDTFLDAVIRAGFRITGTWPMRTERKARSRSLDSNALASSIVIVCYRRPDDAPTALRRDFVAALKAELPTALKHLQRGNIAPVDLAQAAIGPGMGVYTRYAKVLDADGQPLPVREALALINQTLDEVLAEQEGDFDGDSRWALAWFEQSSFGEGEYGVAETLSKAKNTSVGGLVDAGILVSKGGKVRLLKPAELPANWDPARDTRLTAWDAVHHLIRALEAGGESAAADLAKRLGAHAEIARELAYRLYTVCERKKRASEALSYNALVQSWPEILRLTREGERPTQAQTSLLDDEE